MVVPNYIPDPVEIPGNVTLLPYRERVGFIRRVLAMHFASLGLIALFAAMHISGLPLMPAAILTSVCVLVLSLVRIETRGTRADILLSTALLPVLLVGLSFLVRGGLEAGIPLWSIPIGAACALLYALLCGRDYSFVGQWFLGIIASNVAIAVLINTIGDTGSQAWTAVLLNSAYFTYLVYDSASLMARRRLGEEIAAVVDLYRDVLNFFGYAVRCARHWRKHRIWTAR